MGRLTTHVLDTAHGHPGRHIKVRLYQVGTDASRSLVAETQTNDDGRCDHPLLEGDAMRIGTYRLEFEAGAYFRAMDVTLDDPAFLDVVALEFGISDLAAHYHVPLLISPFGYSTYRGS